MVSFVMGAMSDDESDSDRTKDSKPASSQAPTCRQACPVCGGRLIEIRAKLQCSQCRTIVETCCEGGPDA